MRTEKFYATPVNLHRHDPDLSEQDRAAFDELCLLSKTNPLTGTSYADPNKLAELGFSSENIATLFRLGYLAPGSDDSAESPGQMAVVRIPLARLYPPYADKARTSLLDAALHEGGVCTLNLSTPQAATAFLRETYQMGHEGLLSVLHGHRFIDAVYDCLEDGEEVKLLLFGQAPDLFQPVCSGDTRACLGCWAQCGVAFTSKRVFVYREAQDISESQLGNHSLAVGSYEDIFDLRLSCDLCTDGLTGHFYTFTFNYKDEASTVGYNSLYIRLPIWNALAERCLMEWLSTTPNLPAIQN